MTRAAKEFDRLDRKLLRPLEGLSEEVMSRKLDEFEEREGVTLLGHLAQLFAEMTPEELRERDLELKNDAANRVS